MGPSRTSRDPADREDRADPDLALAVREVLVARELALVEVLDPVDPVHIKVRGDRAGRVVLVEPDRADREDRADLDREALVDRLDRAGRVGRRHRRTRRGASTIGPAPTSAAHETSRAASARPATVHRRRPLSTHGAGITGLRLEGRRPSGTGRRPRAVGTARHLLGAGIPAGTGRRAT